jgi:hypothetical protein
MGRAGGIWRFLVGSWEVHDGRRRKVPGQLLGHARVGEQRFVMENSGNVDGLPLESLRCLGWLAGWLAKNSGRIAPLRPIVLVPPPGFGSDFRPA